MRQRGFTLIELVIASAIFATVLMMAFTAVAAINRLQRQVRSQRLFYGTAQSTWQTISQLGRYAQKPASALAGCSVGTAGFTLPSTSLTEAVTVQDNGRRLWLVTPNMATGNSYRVFVFAATNVDAESRYLLNTARFTASASSCTLDLSPVELLGSSDLRLRVLPTDPAPFALTTAGAAVVTGVPQPNALASATAWGLPWRLKINLSFVRSSGDSAVVPVFGQISSRTPQGVITNQ